MQMGRRAFLECIGAGTVAAVFACNKLTRAGAQQPFTQFEIEYFLDGKLLGRRGVWDYPTNELIPPGKKVVERVHIYRGTEHGIRERTVGRDTYGNFVN